MEVMIEDLIENAREGHLEVVKYLESGVEK